MSSGKMFWGVIFLIIGLLILLGNFGILQFESAYIWRLWPLILIFFGAASLVGSLRARWIILGIVIIIAGILIATGPFIKGRQYKYFLRNSSGAATSQELSEPYDLTIKNASLVFNSGAGDFYLEGTTDQLITASTKVSDGLYNMETTGSGSSKATTLTFGKQNSHIWLWDNKNTVRMSLNPNPIWNLDFNLGAANINFDISACIVNDLRISSGAVTQQIKLGELADTLRFTLKTGASSTHILVPTGAGAEVQVSSALNSNNFSGFDKISSGTYRTSNFNDAVKKIYINIDSGASTINIDRY